MNLTMDILSDWSIRGGFTMEEDLSALVKTEDLATMDPYPFYPILDNASDMCTGGKSGDGCEVCGAAELHQGEFGTIPCPSKLPLLDWSDVEDQLGEPEQDEMRCININQIFNMPAKASPQDKVIVEHTDKVISDCMWSSSSAHRLDMSELGTSPLPALSVENDVEFSRPDTPQTDTESHYTDSDDLIQRVPKEESVARRLAPVPEKPPVTSGRSLLKRNQFSLKVARAPLRPESKPSVTSPTGDSSYSGDHSYSATNCIGILTPSPSPSESSSDDDNNDSRTARHHARRRATVDSQALQERLHRPLKARKRNAGAMKYRSDRCRMPSDDDQAPPERRNNHNNMERLRRDLLRGALNSLRRLVPDTAGNDKAPKITVLREAAKYCLMLRSKDEMLNKQKRRLEEQRVVLERRLELLQRSCR